MFENVRSRCARSTCSLSHSFSTDTDLNLFMWIRLEVLLNIYEIVTADERDRLPVTRWHLKYILPFTMHKAIMKQCSAVSACSQFDISEADVFVRSVSLTACVCVALSPEERCSFVIHLNESPQMIHLNVLRRNYKRVNVRALTLM